MKKYRYYLFDFDGTLVDSFDSLYIVFARAFKAVGIEIDEKDVPWMSRVPLDESYDHYHGIRDDEHIDKFIKAIEEALDSEEALKKTKLFADSRYFFDFIKKNGISCGIVTSNRRRHVEDVLNFFKIDKNILSVIVGNEISKATKPDPDPIYQALRLLDYHGDKKDVVYIGDSLNDCLAAKNAGIETYLLDRNNSQECEYQKITSLMQLFE